MVEFADGLFGVHRYPHVDCFEAGVKAVRILESLVLGAARPVVHVEWLPMMLPSVTTELGPMRGLRICATSGQQHPSVIDCTMFHGIRDD